MESTFSFLLSVAPFGTLALSIPCPSLSLSELGHMKTFETCAKFGSYSAGGQLSRAGGAGGAEAEL